MSVLAVLLTASALAPQAPCSAIQELKQKVYTFRPNEIDANAREAKTKEMDAFWDLVESRKDEGAACLRRLLTDDKTDGFFLFDGASLLASLDQSPASLQVVADSIVRSRLADIDAGSYVRLAIMLAREGIDIGPVAVRFLEHPSDKVEAPAHALTIDRMYAASLVFGAMPIDRAQEVLIRALDSGQPRVREAAAATLAILLTEEAFRTLSQSPRVQALPAAVQAGVNSVRTHRPYQKPSRPILFTREQVLDYLRLLPNTEAEHKAAYERQTKYEGSLPTPKSDEEALRRMEEFPPFLELAGHVRFLESAIANLSAADLAVLREGRRKSVRGLSDEVLGDFFAYTAVILGVINRLDLYPEYRIRK